MEQVARSAEVNSSLGRFEYFESPDPATGALRTGYVALVRPGQPARPGIASTTGLVRRGERVRAAAVDAHAG